MHNFKPKYDLSAYLEMESILFLKWDLLYKCKQNES